MKQSVCEMVQTVQQHAPKQLTQLDASHASPLLFPPFLLLLSCLPPLPQPHSLTPPPHKQDRHTHSCLACILSYTQHPPSSTTPHSLHPPTPLSPVVPVCRPAPAAVAASPQEQTPPHAQHHQTCTHHVCRCVVGTPHTRREGSWLGRQEGGGRKKSGAGGGGEGNTQGAGSIDTN